MKATCPHGLPPFLCKMCITEKRQASEDELARITEQTVEEMYVEPGDEDDYLYWAETRYSRDLS